MRLTDRRNESSDRWLEICANGLSTPKRVVFLISDFPTFFPFNSTGGTRGIGAAIVKSLAAQGCMVAAGYGGNKEIALQFEQEFRREYPHTKLTLHQGDIGSPEDCRRVVREVVEQHGRIDILINNGWGSLQA